MRLERIIISERDTETEAGNVELESQFLVVLVAAVSAALLRGRCVWMYVSELSTHVPNELFYIVLLYNFGVIALLISVSSVFLKNSF